MHTRTRTFGSAPQKGFYALNDDIYHSILCQMPDFRTLTRFAMTCRGFYNYVFRDNPRGIMRSVACNIMGSSAGPESALRVIRIEEILSKSAGVLTAAIIDALSAVREDDPLEIEHNHFKLLEERLLAGRHLEVVYSRSCKNRLTRSDSLLSAAESELFQTALHRACLVSSLYSHDMTHIPAGSSSDWPTGAVVNHLLLSNLPAPHIAAFSTVWRWLASILYDPGRPSSWLSGTTKCAALARGPLGALQLLNSDKFEADRLNILYHNIGRTHLDLLLSQCDSLMPRSMLPPQDAPRDAAAHTRGILSAVVGANECCSKCGDQAGLALWNAQNASSPPRDLQRSTLARHLGGMLRYSLHDGNLLVQALERLERWELERIKLAGETHRPVPGLDIAMGRLISGIFEIDDAESLVKRAYVLPDKDLDANTLLCAKCLGVVLDGRVWAWWLIQTETVYQFSDPRRVDCWFGSDCRRQLEKVSHREKFNHACLPSQAFIAYKAQKKRLREERRARRFASERRASGDFLDNSLEDDFPVDLVSLASSGGDY
ncbi:hypothetical protein AURDEDRAFT_153367 [Auricularia subglabra TFB-10046 SS5]|nr:hypothetical protein AURDEDRAFT_153367 [Auricularia subglabra TFB-10046 SS5]